MKLCIASNEVYFGHWKKANLQKVQTCEGNSLVISLAGKLGFIFLKRKYLSLSFGVGDPSSR